MKKRNKQTLAKEWKTYCKQMSASESLSKAGAKLFHKGEKLWTEAIESKLGKDAAFYWKLGKTSGPIGYNCQVEKEKIYRFKKVKMTLESALKSVKR